MTLDRKRLENGSFLGEDYFERLLAEVREIRLSERRCYQKVTDIYATAVDYNRDAPTAKAFFAKVQNKLHFAIHGYTAAELIKERADATKLEDWAKRLDAFLEFTDRDILQNAGKVSAEMAKAHAQSEFEKYRIVQDRMFESDFDRAIRGIEGKDRSESDDR